MFQFQSSFSSLGTQFENKLELCFAYFNIFKEILDWVGFILDLNSSS